ncbi:GNAT family N-acetyltransferase [Calidifontibacter sp. DB0510]|uniref:GNAT family N-acetyltransferase n=1 Tax=Metallococcus carri TaxID=1656884 RepID=A0A967EGW9_9MICO|nr:GNAT family N-acetyltransferase [Metallococcus carri]NHN55623.1 GNAT family N-acetyltransferase [Metallococcus carri]NOP38193.1 GNAT family N-acetyltransferase [Calidifontibacter sp. DB2511S]
MTPGVEDSGGYRDHLPEMTTRVLGADDVTDALVDGLTAMLGELVLADAALGWTAPPAAAEVRSLLTELVTAGSAEAAAVVASAGESVAGFGYWRRYARPTHRPHADLEKLAVATEFAGQGVGRRLLRALVDSARTAGIEVLTLDFRGDNTRAERLYLSEGFVEYGRLRDFVAPDETRRFDMVLHALDLRSGAGRPGN